MNDQKLYKYAMISVLILIVAAAIVMFTTPKSNAALSGSISRPEYRALFEGEWQTKVENKTDAHGYLRWRHGWIKHVRYNTSVSPGYRVRVKYSKENGHWQLMRKRWCVLTEGQRWVCYNRPVV